MFIVYFFSVYCSNLISIMKFFCFYKWKGKKKVYFDDYLLLFNILAVGICVVVWMFQSCFCVFHFFKVITKNILLLNFNSLKLDWNCFIEECWCCIFYYYCYLLRSFYVCKLLMFSLDQYYKNWLCFRVSYGRLDFNYLFCTILKNCIEFRA